MATDKEKQVVEMGEYIANTGATVRETGKKFGLSKTTVHADMRQRLPYINKSLYEKVAAVLEKNLAERGIRGGEATKAKFEKLKAICTQ